MKEEPNTVTADNGGREQGVGVGDTRRSTVLYSTVVRSMEEGEVLEGDWKTGHRVGRRASSERRDLRRCPNLTLTLTGRNQTLSRWQNGRVESTEDTHGSG
ncbi:hypothetical protein MPTK1_6g20710 [Marchantia polymorpha subsp. ruderalis]|uniref:Uncharacterized protein n=2 Tax=Marchantia polymorpha TaxID=3197 RepID=A0AAF6BU94_MARPO|nr:hypothetical protein MARPO_0091s0086 [Marchantia polymorpha]BBN15578.1 hypothetical protein Mp_6g20710 [Marchantia polymorpha subsp. ruderalis]|eukprot:PTQ33242.1 hypothetical protein MARPO_0091s0086 [Marchantia polymorpha]